MPIPYSGTWPPKHGPEFEEYIIHLERNSVPYLIDHYNESQLIIDGDGHLWQKRWWFILTDKEKKAHLDSDIDDYFGRETPADELLVVEPTEWPEWLQRFEAETRHHWPTPQDDDY
jgi:hypothetical protein